MAQLVMLKKLIKLLRTIGRIKMNKTELFLKTIEMELETLKNEYGIRPSDLKTIYHAIGVIREEQYEKE